MTLDDLGWRSPQLGEDPRLEAGEVIGRVTVEHRAGYVVATAAGEMSASVAGRLKHDAMSVRALGLPAVGDWVVLRTARYPAAGVPSSTRSSRVGASSSGRRPAAASRPRWSRPMSTSRFSSRL